MHIVIKLGKKLFCLFRYVGENYSNAQEAMEVAMCSFYSQGSTHRPLSNPLVGQLIAVRGEGGDELARAQVTEVMAPNKVKVTNPSVCWMKAFCGYSSGQCFCIKRALVCVFVSAYQVYYVDYGFSVETSGSNLLELNQDFLSLPFQATNVKLAGTCKIRNLPEDFYLSDVSETPKDVTGELFL